MRGGRNQNRMRESFALDEMGSSSAIRFALSQQFALFPASILEATSIQEWGLGFKLHHAGWSDATAAALIVAVNIRPKDDGHATTQPLG